MTTAQAHPNIALVKYWGKQERSGNLPAAPNLSITLAGLTTTTQVTWAAEDTFVLIIAHYSYNAQTGDGGQARVTRRGEQGIDRGALLRAHDLAERVRRTGRDHGEDHVRLADMHHVARVEEDAARDRLAVHLGTVRTS